MQFIDEAKIYIQSGAGGPGCVSFRRAANEPKGGPDGGNGGRGGHVYAKCVPGLNTLIDYRYQQHFKAKRGGHGMGKQRHGANAKDVILKLPQGTQIIDAETDAVLADMTEIGQSVMLATGGQGGLGNEHFKSSRRQSPQFAQPGEEGEERTIWLKLKLLADVGLLGMPNAGKSTFLSVVTRAKPKIADYPFTTLKPQLGVTYIDGKEFVIADIPGLIKNAHKGQGLGDRFLKHIERCRVLLHLIDVTQENPLEAYHTIRAELKSYSPELAEKPEVTALTKTDAVQKEAAEEIEAVFEEAGLKPLLVSSVAKIGTDALLRSLLGYVERKDVAEQET